MAPAMSRPLPYPTALLTLTAIYFGAGTLGLSLAILQPNASAVWPPTGLALAALLLFGYRLWPAVFIGAFLVNLAIKTPLAPSLAIATGNTLEAVAGAILTRRFANGLAAFDRAAGISRYVFCAVLPSTALSPTIGVTALTLFGKLNNYFPVWLTWWTGDFVSDLVVAPLLVVWFTRPPVRLQPKRLIEALCLAAALLLYGRVIFGAGLPGGSARHPLAHLGIPLLLWAALRFRHRGATAAALIVSAVAVWGTLHGSGSFAVGGPNDSLLLLQAFIGTSTLTALVLAAVVTQHERAQTERQALLDREQAARAEAERANLAKDQFLAVLSHELRTPLTPVMLTASIMEANDQLPQAVRADAHTIRRNVELEARLIDDLLDLSRIANGKLNLNLQPVEIHALLEAVREMTNPDAASKRMSLHWKLDARNDRVQGDAARLQQVLWNLLKNAVKFTPEGGQIHVRTRDDGSDTIAVEITDSGIGIGEEALPRIFTPFDQGGQATTRRFGGLGLGLAISKAIAQMHHGAIAAQSPGEGRGSTFTLTLPTTQSVHKPTTPIDRPSPEPAATRLSSPKSTAANLRVLLVEDHPDTLKALRRYLASVGFAVTPAATVQDALNLLDAQSFDILVSDIDLPDGTGHDVMRHIKHRRLEVSGIALTGFGTEYDIKTSQDAGFAAHLTKPVDVRHLRDTILKLATSTHSIAAG
jgi:signal transduction histidine kinase/CheY-like chemotaxis protein